MKKANTILITGGAGYLGSHAGLALARAGYHVVVLDAYKHAQHPALLWADVYQSDYADEAVLHEIFQAYAVETVIHCAADYEQRTLNSAAVYQEHVAKTITLLSVMLQYDVRSIIFCSTYALDPASHPLKSYQDQHSISVDLLGSTKRHIELLLHDLYLQDELVYVVLRFACIGGAFPECGLGRPHHAENDMIDQLLHAIREQKACTVQTTDTETPDGTIVRDYVHVRDCAHAIVLAMQHLRKSLPSDTFTIATGTATSVNQLLMTVQQQLQCHIKTVLRKKTDSLPAMLVGDPTRAYALLNWQPRYSSMSFILSSTWNYLQKHQRTITQVRV